MGASIVTAVGSGCTATEGGENQADRENQEEDEPIEFGESAALLLQPDLLPGDGWEEGEREEADILDVTQSFVREFDEGEEVDGDEGNNWLVTSAVAGRDGAGEAAELYEELEADFVSTVGNARVMEFELASDGAIAGYDGLTAAIFREVNCVASVGFTDCVTLDGPCYSDVGRVRELARIQRDSWRDPSEDAETGDGEGEGADESEGDESDDEQPSDGDLTFEGEGTQVTEGFDLERGFLAVAYEHDGTENFIVRLVDTGGEEPDRLLANEIGSVEGRTAEGVDGGEYLLDMQADGAWRIDLSQPRPDEADAQELPVTIEGGGNDHAGPFRFEGLVRAVGQHDGGSNFIVNVRDENGNVVDLLFNEIGRFEGETVFTHDGLGWLTVEGDGNWTIELEHD